MVISCKKYSYLGLKEIDVPDPWKPIILDMLIKIDLIIKPKFVPRKLINLFYLIDPKSFSSIINITSIKQKFGSLRITGTYSQEIQAIIDATITKCNDTCEFCGNSHTQSVMIKSWVRNICATCQEVKKYGSNN